MRYIKIDGQQVPVTEEVYKVYHQMGRRRRYLEEDRKVGRINVDVENQKVEFVPSKEDSIERLMENGTAFQDGKSVEDIVCDRAMLLVLNEALKELDQKERQILYSLHDEGLTTRVTSKKVGGSHVTIGTKNKKALDKLKRYFIKKGYEDYSYID